MHYVFVNGDIHSRIAGSMTEIVGDDESRSFSVIVVSSLQLFNLLLIPSYITTSKRLKYF